MSHDKSSSSCSISVTFSLHQVNTEFGLDPKIAGAISQAADEV